MLNQALIVEGILNRITAAQLNSIFDKHGNHIQTLSLDCFDTLLWRTVATPADVFYTLQYQPTFQLCKLSALMRSRAEIRARETQFCRQQSSEVMLNDIYRAHHAALTDEQLALLSAEELSVEKSICHAFQPIVELIRAALKRNVKVIIVSDTYFTEKQLRELLMHCLPMDVMQGISQLFCSSEYGVNKINGLFGNVLQKLGQAADTVLHVGDNFQADFVAARLANIQALHFIPEEESLTDLFRLQATAASILNPAVHTTQPLLNPFRSLLAEAQLTATRPETLIGYASLGPIMYLFARFILHEIETLNASDHKVKTVFLMRDGYLPSLAFAALQNQCEGYRVHISRFVAYAASFRVEADIDHYLIGLGKTDRLRDIAKQLLLPSKVADPLIAVAERHVNPHAEFVRQLHRKDITRIILTKSAAYRERLHCYLQKEVGLQAGDTLMLVDLGYSGTVQRQLAPIFAEWQNPIVGRYLLMLSIPEFHLDRCGLLDPSWCDEKVLLALTNQIALLEQLCTSNESSVLDYDKDGCTIFSDVKMMHGQQDKLTRIQAECVRFVRDASLRFPILDYSLFRSVVLHEIGRMLFLPTKYELDFLQSFQFDLNMGTQDVYRLFDPEQGLKGLRRRGLFFIDRQSKKMRTNYPAELRAADFAFALTSMVQCRFGIDIQMRDTLPREEKIEAILSAHGVADTRVVLDAVATHDGYFAVWAPVGAGLQLLLGKKYRWVQLDSAEFIERDAFITQNESLFCVDGWGGMEFNYINDKSGGLYECSSAQGCVVVKPVVYPKPGEYIFRLVFRPIVGRVVEKARGGLCDVSYSVLF